MHHLITLVSFVISSLSLLPQVCDDSGSETGSESMLPMMEDEEERSPSPVLSSRQVQSGIPLTVLVYLNLHYASFSVYVAISYTVFVFTFLSPLFCIFVLVEWNID